MADIKSLTAANAYANTAKMKGGLETPYLPGEGPNSYKPNFSELVADSLDKAQKAGYGSEAVSAEAVADKAELHELVTAVTNADLTLQTVVTIRDKMIAAYQDIIKMPI